MQKCKLGKYIQVKHGYPFKSQFFSDNGKYIILTPGNFYEEGGFKVTPGKEKFYTDEFPEEYLCNKNDLIVVMTEQVRGLLGSTALVPEDGKYLHNQRIGLITYDENVISRDFLNYLFRTKTVRSQLEGSASGTKIKHTSPDRICDVEVELPSLEEQQRIGKLLKDIDDKIATNNETISTLESLSKTLYDYYFLQFDFPDEKGRPYKSSGGKMEYNAELGREIPAGWKVGRISDLGEVVSGGTPSTQNEDYFTSEGIAWITPKDMSLLQGKWIFHGETDITKEGLKNSSAKLMPAGSVVYTTRAPIGYVAVAANEVCTNQGFKSVSPNKDIGTEFVYYTLLSLGSHFKNIGNGSTFSEVSKETFSNVPICLPPRDKLQSFAKVVNNLSQQQKNAQSENRHLTALRDFLLPLLMNGQVGFKK